ncbi:LAME_0F10924g1_1 [Lachancea meyersii CBS 8951]|uniref:LAME_0F10924g1_1 n=1 Tax=Lachancea meyersii CBS 8951 TaxID=1266667 RepID=A0A1G4JVV3_9SACH|nr:LAME_0F10924g1_1 [Lachancea meyersii CBS 8951]
MATTAHPYRQNLATSTLVNYNVDDVGNNDLRHAKREKNDLETHEIAQDYGNSELEATLQPPQIVQQHRKSASSPVTSTTDTPNSSQSNFQGSSTSVLDLRTASEGHTSRQHRKNRKSLDLSHLFLLGDKDTQFTATNESVADLSHQMISEYLGEAHNSSLVPRLKTIEMYKQNVRKSKDPNVLFQYAQYMLQTALTIDTTGMSESSISINKEGGTAAHENMRRQFLKEAQTYLKKLSVKGYADAQYLLGDAYSSGAFGKVNNRDAFVLFQSAAKHGHVESAFRTAHCFEEGLGTTRDSRKAVEFLKFAASRNHPSAMYKLGLFSFHGRMGLSNDISTKQNGIKWLSRAAARANELTNAAPYELAKIYRNGFLDIIIPDVKYAMELYIQAASLKHAQSSTALGKIYESGNEVVPPDTSLSVHYYTQAALLGEPHAMLGLCAWYLIGAEPVLEKDEREAFQWALKAAKLGLSKAQFTVGYFYEKGKGCGIDASNARHWYELAAKNNDPRAINKLSGENVAHVKKQKSNTALNLFASISSSNLLDGGREPSPIAPHADTLNQPSVLAPLDASGPSEGITGVGGSEVRAASGPSDGNSSIGACEDLAAIGGGNGPSKQAFTSGTQTPAAFDLTDNLVPQSFSEAEKKPQGTSSKLTSAQKDKKSRSKRKDKKCVIM